MGHSLTAHQFQVYCNRKLGSGFHNVSNPIASELKPKSTPKQDTVQLTSFNLKKLIKIDYENFIKKHKKIIEKIRSRCTPNLSGKITILEDWQNSYFSSHNNITKSTQENEIKELSYQVKLIQYFAQEQCLNLDPELIALFSHVKTIEKFLLSVPTSLAVSSQNTNQKVELRDLFNEIERIEDKIPLAKTQESTIGVAATTRAFVTASDDFNPLLQKYHCPGPSGDHGVFAGLSAAFFDVIGSALARTTPTGRHIEMKINKLSLLIKLDLFLCTHNRSDIPRSLEDRIDNILKEARNFSLTSTTTTKSYQIKKTLIRKRNKIKSAELKENSTHSHQNGKIDLDKEKVAQVENILPISNKSPSFLEKIIDLEAKLAEFAKNGTNHNEIQNSIDLLINKSNPEDLKNISSVTSNKNNPMNIYDYLWKILNRHQYQHTQRGDGGLRRVYYTPIEALTKYCPQLLGDLVCNLNDYKKLKSINDKDNINHYQCLYNYLYNLLETANKDNVIEVMHKVILVINGSSRLNQIEKAHLYRNLLDLRLNPDHGNLFKVANEKRSEALLKKGIINSLRYGMHNISTIEAIASSGSILANELRWPIFTALNKVSESTFYKTYIERAHTLNTILQLHESANKLFQVTNESTDQSVVDAVQVNIDSFTSSEPSSDKLIKDIISDHDSEYIYNKLTAIKEQDGKKLPLFYHLILSKENESESAEKLQQRKEAVINFSNLAQKYDPTFRNALTVTRDQQGETFYNYDCEPTDFERVANLSFASARNPLIALVWIIGFAVQDLSSERSWAKMQIIANILNSINDSRSVLFGKFSPSVAKTFLVEMLVANLVGVGYGVAYALLPLVALPALWLINLSRVAGSNTKTINILLGKLTNPNRKIAANALLEFINKDNNEAHKNINNHNLDYYSQLKKDLERRELKKYQPTNQEEQTAQSGPSTASSSPKKKASVEQIDLIDNSLSLEKEAKFSLSLEKEAQFIINKIIQKYPLNHNEFMLNNPIEVLTWALHLDKNSTQEQLLRKLLLMSYVINMYECKNEDKVKILAHILYALRFGVIAATLRQSNSHITDQFFDRKNLITSVMTLGPYTAPKFISDQTLGAITGLVVDATGSFATNLMGNKMPRALTKGYVSIMKNFKNQLLEYSKIAFTRLRNPQIEAFAYGALGAHRSTLGCGETYSQERLRSYLKRVEKSKKNKHRGVYHQITSINLLSNR